MQKWEYCRLLCNGDSLELFTSKDYVKVDLPNKWLDCKYMERYINAIQNVFPDLLVTRLFQFHEESFCIGDNAVDIILNYFGSSGWELIEAYGIYYFKRQIDGK